MAEGVALLVLDMQNDIMGFQDKDALPAVVATIGRLLSWARSSRVPVIYSRVAFRPGYVDALPQLPTVKTYGILDETKPGSDVIDELAPQEGDIVVVKRRVGAFYNTELELVLRSLGIGTLLLAGVSTDRVVESTVRDASDRNFRNIVVSDGCTSSTDGRHKSALESIAGFFGEVMSADEAMTVLA
ncbi:cysteine hydrolase family protein [Oricola indica]|uniref:cysteine hydrolase family protein n=1 Tax=Oricola indica TaxID=2872591 RepID=UPI003CCC0B05